MAQKNNPQSPNICLESNQGQSKTSNVWGLGLGALISLLASAFPATALDNQGLAPHLPHARQGGWFGYLGFPTCTWVPANLNLLCHPPKPYLRIKPLLLHAGRGEHPGRALRPTCLESQKWRDVEKVNVECENIKEWRYLLDSTDCQVILKVWWFSRDFAIGHRIGLYKIKGELGSGNFSRVRLASHELTQGAAFHFLSVMCNIPPSLR